MLVNDGFDFARVDILAAGNNHVLQPIENVDVTISILVPDVPSAKHAVKKCRVRFFQIVPIAAHYICAPGNQLTMLASSNLISLVVNNFHFNAGTSASARYQSAFCMFMILQSRKKARFTEPINLNEFSFG